MEQMSETAMGDKQNKKRARRLVAWMQKTLVLSLDEAVREAALWEVDKPREEWLFGFPAELALLAGQVRTANAASFGRAPTYSPETRGAPPPLPGEQGRTS